MFEFGVIGSVIVCLVLIITFVMFYGTRKDHDCIQCTLCSLVIGVFVYFIIHEIIRVGYFTSKDNYTKSEIVSTLNIKSIKPTDGVSGSFFLGSGNSNGYFYTLVEVDKDVYQKRKYSINDTYIKETGDHKIVKYRVTYYNDNMKFWIGKHDIYEGESYVLEVPKGTIIEEYQVM